MRFFLKEEALENGDWVGRKQQKARQTGRTRGPFSAKVGVLRRGRRRHFRQPSAHRRPSSIYAQTRQRGMLVSSAVELRLYLLRYDARSVECWNGGQNAKSIDLDKKPDSITVRMLKAAEGASIGSKPADVTLLNMLTEQPIVVSAGTLSRASYDDAKGKRCVVLISK